ncbi:MAG: trypsin-like serine protease [Lachnospiraceae bacterium]|jgi:serine protease Do|nr:trypsin-like serine protease [Lachnospiraceae bacterium]
MSTENKWNEDGYDENGRQEISSTQERQTDGRGMTEGQGTENGRSVQGSQETQSRQQNPAGQNPNPYPYGYYQNQSYWQNAQNGQSEQNSGQPNWGSYGNRYPYQNQYYQGPNRGQGQNPHPSSRTPKKKSGLRATALVTAAALLFGVVAGGTMFGVNRAAQLLLPAPTQATAETEGTKAAPETAPAVPQSATQPVAGNGGLNDVSGIAAAAMPSIVAITNTMLYQSNSWFGPSQTVEVPSSGSGIIVGQNDTELLVVTNNHVIENANSLTVTFVDGSSVEAAVKGTDGEVDLAVIAVPLEKISADTKTQIKQAVLGDSDGLKIGQGVVAIGNALGRGQSLTVGYVSALDREIVVDGVTRKVIQTDAAINPGNSGGALLNANGEVIGINEAKYANSDVEGIGYAIPVSQVKDIIDDLMTRTTKVEVAEEEQGYLGVRLRNVDASAVELYGMPQGAFVYQILEGTAADASELREKDIITRLDGERVTSAGRLTELLAYYKAGDTVTLTVSYLENGAYVEREVAVTLGERPQEENTQS